MNFIYLILKNGYIKKLLESKIEKKN